MWFPKNVILHAVISPQGQNSKSQELTVPGWFNINELRKKAKGKREQSHQEQSSAVACLERKTGKKKKSSPHRSVSDQAGIRMINKSDSDSRFLLNVYHHCVTIYQ